MAAAFRFSVDGRLADPGEAFLPLPDDGFLRGDGVFEVVRIYGGRAFALGLHLDRMESSARAIDLKLERELLEADAERLITEAEGRDCLIRLVQSRAGRRVLSLEDLPDHRPTISLATVSYSPTLILNGVKSLSYAANMQATRMARASGAEEALFVRPDGVVLEPPTSSIFWAGPEGQLRTPALEAGVLDSITRRKIVERIEVEEGDFPLEDLMNASEAFLASTTREAHPVSAIDGQELPTVDGPKTKEAAAAFAAALESELGS